MLSHTEEFVQQLTAYQPQLRVLVEMLLGDRTAANDVLQETNLLLCRKAEEFVEGTDFAAWAASVARFKVLSYLRDAGRDRLVIDADLAEQLAEHTDRLLAAHDARQEALRHCLDKLTPSQQQLVRERYYRDQSVSQLAQHVGRSQAGVQMALSRIRHLLFDCIRERLAREGN
jgi:RNA polymerase sigma-70 factor (ECF subfamily)